MAGFCKLAGGLQPPNLAGSEAKTLSLKYSRFQETGTGDWVRSALGGRAGSVTRQILCPGHRQIGNAEPGLPRGMPNVLSATPIL